MLAGWVARQMGLPIRRLIVAANSNDILARFFQANDMSMRTVMPTLSPSMDIQVSSNFERLLFELLDHDPRITAQTMQHFRTTGRMEVPTAAWQRARDVFEGFTLDDPGTEAEIAFWHQACGYLADPHTAIGLAAARTLPHDVPVIALATAHPAKFPDAVRRAIGSQPAPPPRLRHLYGKPECYVTVPNDLQAVQEQVRRLAARN